MVCGGRRDGSFRGKPDSRAEASSNISVRVRRYERHVRDDVPGLRRDTCELRRQCRQNLLGHFDGERQTDDAEFGDVAAFYHVGPESVSFKRDLDFTDLLRRHPQLHKFRLLYYGALLVRSGQFRGESGFGLSSFDLLNQHQLNSRVKAQVRFLQWRT